MREHDNSTQDNNTSDNCNERKDFTRKIRPSGRSISLDMGIAIDVSKNAAIIFNWLTYWISENHDEKINVYEGKSWVWHTYAKISAKIKILTPREVQIAMEKLLEADLIVRAKLHEDKRNQTLWYTFPDDIYQEFILKNKASDDEKPKDDRLIAFNSPVKCNIRPALNVYKDILEEYTLENNLSSAASHGLEKVLLESIRKNKPDFKCTDSNLSKWKKTIDRMINQDKRDPEKIKQVIEWAANDPFWKTTILSADKLRDQFDQLEMKMGQPVYKKKADLTEINKKKAEEVYEAVIKKLPEGKIIFEISSTCVEIGFSDHPKRYYFKFDDLEFVTEFDEAIMKIKERFNTKDSE